MEVGYNLQNQDESGTINSGKLFAGVYDRLFPLKSDTLAFITRHIPLGKVMDIGCGTGEYLLEMEKLGYVTKGIDQDQNMIRIAKNKAKLAGLNTKFNTEDMAYLRYRREFDGIIFIGNTLVHAGDETMVSRIIANVYQAMKPCGTLVLQTINYDLVLAKKLDHLPTITYPGVVFERRYRFVGDMIEFQSLVNIDDTVFQHTVLLFPVKYDKLVQELVMAGFKDIVAYDGFSDRHFAFDDSLQLVFVCHK